MRLTPIKQYDLLNRLLLISSVPSASCVVPTSFAYQYNDANQRTRVVLADGAYWAKTCLLRGKKNSNGDPACEAEIDAEIAIADAKIKENTF